MGGQWRLQIHIVFLSLFAVATTYTCLGARNITTGCSEHERLALLKFKNSVKNDYKMLSSWVGMDCCSWKGVRCDGASGSVVGLDLRGNLQYSFSCGGRFATAFDENYLLDEKHFLDSKEMDSSLAELRHLEYLDLSGNDFHGSQIPEFVGTFKQLSYLNLSNAVFSGKIPHYIGNLSNLKVLDLNSLSYSQELMADDMAWISGLSSLDHLDLSGVDLSGAKNRYMVLHLIPSLTDLSLSCCGLANSDLAGPHLNSSRMLPNIRRLDLSWNGIQGRFPSILTNMSSLLTLDLSGNLLNSSTPIIPSLERLDLSDNNFEHIEHIGIWRQCHLKHLSVSENVLGELNGPSTNISKCSHYAFELLDLSGNGLTGSLPESLGRLTSLRVLSLTSNSLNGPIPEALGRLRFLEELDLSYNQLDGPIPTILGPLTKLYLSYNHLNGSIPEWFGTLSALKDLNLQSNQLSGTIPASLRRLASLQVFSVSSNSLNGTLPVQIGRLTNLSFLDVSNNSLEGVILDSHFVNLSMLRYLDLSSNKNLEFNVSRDWIPPFQLKAVRLGSCKIADGFPQWLQTQRNLEALALSNTSIFGPLPTWLRKMPIIPALDLSHNKLSGPLTNLPSGDPWNGPGNEFHRSLLLQDNYFDGSIPWTLCTRTDLEYLDLSRNRLTGNMPNCLMNLKNLHMMIVSSNRLSGVIPSFIGDASPNLAWLNLNDNNFIGELPQDLAKLRALRVLDLGDNGFSGKIPEWIGEKLTSLMVLRLHKNNFSGGITQSLCRSSYLQILDIGHNSLTGHVPSCFGELYGMIEASKRDIRNGSHAGPDESVLQRMKGVDFEYSKTLDLVFNIDLSSNKLVGEIPKELTTLSLLVGLNLSRNHLSGAIPQKIGNMKALNSLDFSENELTGAIPTSIASLNFLSHLNLSHNKLSGRIPTGSQLQTFTDPSIYTGNKDLCGPPLPKNCSKDPTITTSKNKHEADNELDIWLYLGMIYGSATGFWGVIGLLLFKKQWREKLYMFSEVIMEKIYISILVSISKMTKRKKSHVDPSECK